MFCECEGEGVQGGGRKRKSTTCAVVSGEPNALENLSNSQVLQEITVSAQSHGNVTEFAQAPEMPSSNELDDLLGALHCSNVCELSDDGEAQFERIWNSGNVNSRNVTLRSDEFKRLHVPLFDLGLRGRVCIVPRVELPTLIIDASSAAASLESLWGTVVAEFYDPHEAVDMLSVLLYGPWGCFDVPEAVVEFVDEGDTRTVTDLQLWGQELLSPTCSDRSASGEDSEYQPGLSTSSACIGDKLENFELTPNSKKWFITPDLPTRELGLDYDLSFEDFSELPPEKRFAPEMWNSAETQLPRVS